jgi:hypothetical protein
LRFYDPGFTRFCFVAKPGSPADVSAFSFGIEIRTNSHPHMKKRILISIAAGFLALFVGSGLWAQSPHSDSSPKEPQAWQHLAFEHEGRSVTGSPDLARRINSLGDEGWQLVDVESIVVSGSTTRMIFFFKRLK